MPQPASDAAGDAHHRSVALVVRDTSKFGSNGQSCATVPKISRVMDFVCVVPPTVYANVPWRESANVSVVEPTRVAVGPPAVPSGGNGVVSYGGPVVSKRSPC